MKTIKPIQTLKPGDIFIIGCILFCIVASLFSLRSRPGHIAIITVNNIKHSEIALTKDQTISILGLQGEIIIEVQAGQIGVAKSDCPQKVCMRTGMISRQGQMIVCLPNRLMIRIEGNGSESLDGITE